MKEKLQTRSQHHAFLKHIESMSLFWTKDVETGLIRKHDIKNPAVEASVNSWAGDPSCDAGNHQKRDLWGIKSPFVSNVAVALIPLEDASLL